MSILSMMTLTLMALGVVARRFQRAEGWHKSPLGVPLPGSRNAVSFSSARTFLRDPLRYQTHREPVYRPFQLYKRSQDFIRTHDETLLVAMRVNNPDRSPLEIDSRDPVPTLSEFADIGSDDFPVFHSCVC